MPHVVLEQAKSVKKSFELVQTGAHKIDGGILKITDKYLNAREDSALIESIAVENGKPQTFFIQISAKGEAVTVRLLPLTDPQKTNGVKTLMGIVANMIKSSSDEITYGKTNLQDFLI
jgi:hypothetical protein